MKFLHPSSLWLLVFIPIVYFILLWDEKRRLKRFEMFAQRSLWPVIAPEINVQARMRKIILWLMAGAFAILAMARPQWGTQEEVAKMSGLDVMAVLDVSNSMETEDVIPSRLKKAKHFLRTVAERLQGDRLGLVTFAGGASVATPLTTDTEYFLEQLEIQNPKTIPTQGTDIGLGIEIAVRAMERGAAQSGQGKEEVPSRAIILITDGEDFEGSAREAAAALKSQGIKLFVFGLGTEKGGPVPVRDDSGTLINYKRDRNGKPVVSTFHPDDLVQIAAAAGGRYWNVTVDESEISDLLKDMGALTRGEFSEHHYLVYKERFQYPLSVAVLLLLLEMSLSVRTTASSSSGRRKTAAVVLALGFLSGTVFLSSSAQAAGIDTYQDNKKGIEAYKSGKIEEAQKEFGAAQARDPNLPELQYNQGLVHMQQGDADAAAHDFQEAARGAMKNGNNELLSKDFFNLGAALSKKGDLKGALQSYLAAIGSAKKSGNGKLEEDARKNIELLVQQQKQQQQQKNQQQNQQNQQQQQQQNQQQQQGQQQQRQGQNSKDSKDKGSQGEQQKKDEKQGDQKKDQQKDQQDKQDQKQFDNSTSRGKKFDSKKLAPEDAERVMNELKSREKELQGRMKKQNGHYSSQSNDW